MKTKTYNLVNSVEQDELDAGLLAEYYFVEANDGKSVTLPNVFSSEVREDIIRSAVLASRQPPPAVRPPRARRQASPPARNEALRGVVGQGPGRLEDHA